MKTSLKRLGTGLLAALIACAAGAPGGVAYQEGRVTDGGTISGTVRLSGELPESLEMRITKDEKWCGTRKKSPRIFGINGGIANAVISLESIKQGKPLHDEKRLLAQVSCEFQPHVVLLPMGSSLEIVNDDPLLHNVRTTDRKGRTVFNIAQPVKGQRFAVKPEKFSEPGSYEVSCDAGHPWMSAHIIVTEHPYYVVTDEKGRFALKDVPEGIYRVRMWHEGITIRKDGATGGQPYRYEEDYEEVRQVKVGKNATVTVDFLIAPGQPATAGK